MSTADNIMDQAQHYIQTCGYNAFSYKDIANDLGVKTSSIHYHYPKKEDLGVAVIKRYTDSFERMQESDELKAQSYQRQLELYLEPFITVHDSRVKICLCAALGGETSSLPQSILNEVNRFFCLHEHWLTTLLSEGRETGEFAFNGTSQNMANFIFSALQGAILIARSKNDPSSFKGVLSSIRKILAN